jgi:predicted ATPase/transcriptional regulator with XRE-family HTH domain
MVEGHSFGYWLKRKRKALDLTREGLAGRVACSAATIQKLEEEERRPSAQIVERLAEIFNVPQNERPAFLRFARGEIRSIPVDSEEDFPWHGSTKPVHSNLPGTVTSLIGRQQEIALVQAYLQNPNIRLVTLMGPPGIGKTRLSIEATRRLLPSFPDGIFFVSLAPLNNEALVASAIMHALGFMESGEFTAREQLIGGIGDRQMLIVLDNCEHVIEEVTTLVSSLLLGCSSLKILATSRDSLRVRGEWLYPVPTFEVPAEGSAVDIETASNFPALTLFAERARAVQPSFALNADNIETVAAICAHLDGLPLVIELIAARMRLMSPGALLERMSGQFVLTVDGMRGASERQQTLNNAIAWSYNLLSPEEQKLFGGLSVFSGSFTLDAAESIFSGSVSDQAVSYLVTLLLDKSLLQRVAEREPNDEPRYTMLETIHEFAKERLRETGAETEIRNAHLMYFLNLAEQADQELRGPNQLTWLQRLSAERDNLRAAQNWAIETKQTQKALKMARKLHWFWFVPSDHKEGQEWLERVLEMPDASSYPSEQAEALTQVVHHRFLLGQRFDPESGENQIRKLLGQALSIAAAHSDRHNRARALTLLGVELFEVEKKFAEAESVLEESKALYLEVGDRWGFAFTLMIMAWGFYTRKDQESALSINKKALALFRKLGDRYYMCVVLRAIGILHMRRGNPQEGADALRESLTLAQQLGSKYEIAGALYRWGEAAQHMGSPERTVCLYWAAKTAYDSIGLGVWSQGLNSEFETDLTPFRAALGESAFQEAMEKGRAMSMEQAIAYALDDQE